MQTTPNPALTIITNTHPLSGILIAVGYVAVGLILVLALAYMPRHRRRR